MEGTDATNIFTLQHAFIINQDVFASTIGATDCAMFMHRIEGLTWGPKSHWEHQQLLYATGYTGSAGAPPPVNDVVRTNW